MAQIQKLPPDVSVKIAAGEVVERPSSVAKELIENALDATATRISIDLLDGGRALLKVEDNGTGIAAKELPIAVQNFSTSKISSIDDLSRVRTLGFRGEALASIRCVSQFTIRSRVKQEELGREMRFKGEELVGDAPCARNAGVEVVVENLFFNLPARRKFLRSGQSELRRIISVIQGYALAFPDTSFLLRENGKDILSYPAAGSRERVEAVLGSEFAGHLIPVELQSGSARVRGFVSNPDFTRANRYLQFFFVNHRAVKDRLISHAVNQGFQSLIPRDRFPAAVIFLDMPPEEIDVNVHPAKAEIRFRNESDVHRAILASIEEALRGKAPSFAETVASVYRGIFPGPAEGTYRAPDRAGAITESGGAPPAVQEIGEGDGTFELHEAPLSLFGEDTPRSAFGSGNLYWQLHQSFILIQIRDGMVIIDQHAAHERILFDRAKGNLNGERPVIQSLLFPATRELSLDEYQRYEELAALLGSLGFEIEPFGPRSIIVRGVPAGVKNWNDGRLLEEILGGEGRSGVDDFLKTYACRSAIKAGTKLSGEEMESLADQLFATDLPYTCPHGRPTMLRVGTAELERRFSRTVSSRK